MNPELSRPLALDRIGSSALDVAITASEAECAAVADRLRIPALGALSCRFALRRDATDGLRVLAEGWLSARPTYECVVTLDAFEAELTDAFRLCFVPAGTETEDDDPDSDDEVPYQGGGIDLGEAAVEQLALALDPYPRKPGASVEPIADEADTPFAALASLRRTQ